MPLPGSANYFKLVTDIDNSIVEFVLSESRRTHYAIEQVMGAVSVHWNMIYISEDGREHTTHLYHLHYCNMTSLQRLSSVV